MDPRGHPRLLGETLGVVVFQDMVQKYGRASKATVPLFVSDAAAMVHGRRNHPSILQWTAFNEGDCWEVFDTPPHDVAGVVALFKRLDPTRLVDTDSGGRANDRHIADVNDIHSYPFPHDARPSGTPHTAAGGVGVAWLARVQPGAFRHAVRDGWRVWRHRCLCAWQGVEAAGVPHLPQGWHAAARGGGLHRDGSPPSESTSMTRHRPFDTAPPRLVGGDLAQPRRPRLRERLHADDGCGARVRGDVLSRPRERYFTRTHTLARAGAMASSTTTGRASSATRTRPRYARRTRPSSLPRAPAV